MYSLTSRSYLKVAHSLKGDIFGPSQLVHVITYEVDTTYVTEALDEHNLIIDFDVAQRTLENLLSRMNFKNLDDLPEFKNVNTTTECLCRHLHDRMAERLGDRFRGTLTVTLRESPIAWASYEAPIGGGA